jgi:hypothetical protein
MARELWADKETVGATANSIHDLGGWCAWQEALYDLCDRFDWHPLSHLLESGRQRINVSDLYTTIHALEQVPAFHRDVTGRLTIMSRHVQYIKSL